MLGQHDAYITITKSCCDCHHGSLGVCMLQQKWYELSLIPVSNNGISPQKIPKEPLKCNYEELCS